MCNKEDFNKLIEKKRKMIRDNPITSVAIASGVGLGVGVGVGIITGLLIWRKKWEKKKHHHS